MKRETRAKMKGYLEGFIHGLLDNYTPKSAPSAKRRFVDFDEPAVALEYLKEGSYKPFHLALLPIEIIRISAFVNGFETSLGNAFEECARLFALERYPSALRGYKLVGELYDDAETRIKDLLEDVGDNTIRNNYPDLVRQVVKTGDKLIARTRKVDLYLQDASGHQFFFEMKGPKPNKEQALSVTSRLLQIHAILHETPPMVQTFYAMAYNPYSDGVYRHSISLKYLDMKNQVLVGNEFWKLIGGSTAYKELLELFQEVREEKGKDIIDRLAFNLS